jgi:hypothetical protein
MSQIVISFLNAFLPAQVFREVEMAFLMGLEQYHMPQEVSMMDMNEEENMRLISEMYERLEDEIKA